MYISVFPKKRSSIVLSRVSWLDTVKHHYLIERQYSAKFQFLRRLCIFKLYYIIYDFLYALVSLIR